MNATLKQLPGLSLACSKCGVTERIEAEKRYLIVQWLESSGWIYMRAISGGEPDVVNAEQICPECASDEDRQRQESARSDET